MCLKRYFVCRLSDNSHHSLIVLFVSIRRHHYRLCPPPLQLQHFNNNNRNHPIMSSFPIRGLQNASDVDKSNVPTLPISDRETEHKELPVDGNPAPSSPSYVSEGHDHASNHGSETPSEPQARSDPVSESSGGSEHMDWSPISPVISTPGHSGPSSDDDDDDDEVNASTTAATKESLLDSAALLPLPTFSPGLLTHAHQQAMANRITYDAIAPGAIFDPTTYTPVFLHDTLMLPGSLAAVLGKVRDPTHPVLLKTTYPISQLTLEHASRNPNSTSSNV